MIKPCKKHPPCTEYCEAEYGLSAAVQTVSRAVFPTDQPLTHSGHQPKPVTAISSMVYQLMRDGVSDMHCMSDLYLADELKLEYAEKAPDKCR